MFGLCACSEDDTISLLKCWISSEILIVALVLVAQGRFLYEIIYIIVKEGLFGVKNII